MSVNKDNIKLGNRYQMIVESRQQELLEEGIKDVVLAGLLGLMAMTSVQGKDITKDTGRNINKDKIEQMVKSASSIDQLKKVILQLVDSEIKEDQATIKDLQQTHGQVERGFEKAPDSIKANHMLDNTSSIEHKQEHIQELQQLQQEIKNTTDAGKIANLVHNAQIAAQNIQHQQDMNSFDNIGRNLKSIQSALR